MPRVSVRSKLRELFQPVRCPKPTIETTLKFEVNFCDLCLGVFEWLAKPGPDAWPHRGYARMTCQFCEEVLQKPQQAVLGDGTTKENDPLRLLLWRSQSSRGGGQDLYSMASAQWFERGSLEPLAQAHFALWTMDKHW
jgi:hypothetical protein